MSKPIKQYGTWPGLISPESIGEDLRLQDVQWDTDGNMLVWLEGRGKKGVLVVKTGTDAPRDLIGGNISVRGGVGYGGGEFSIRDSIVYFAGNGGRLYRLALDGGVPRPITPAFGNAASPSVSPDGEWVVYVHTYENQDGLALVDTYGKSWPIKFVFGTDFVMQPTWHPDSKKLAYITWDHPNMPWDGTELKLATLTDESPPRIESVEIIVGDLDTAIFQPEFSPDGRYLSYISDATGFGQIYLYDLQEKTHTQITKIEAEHGTPAWVQGLRVYSWTADARSLYFFRNTQGFITLHRYDMTSGKESQNFGVRQYSDMKQLTISSDGELAMIASSSTISPRVVTFSGKEGLSIHCRAGSESIFPERLSRAVAIEWEGHDSEVVHGLYYPPINDRYEGSGLPPLVVIIHGGPTSQRVATYDAEVQFYTTRGYAALQVNHRGSTGYGRAYMNKLRGNWGIYDVEDSASGVQYLADQNIIDGSGVIITGGSAGGFTVLQSLVTKPGFYKAGICAYGISNQFMLAYDTHKFEARYNDLLLGPLPQAAAVYRERSPLLHAEKIVDPVLIFQGEQDNVVPKSQSDSVVEVLRARGIPHQYYVYEDEGHGFRKLETIIHRYEKTLEFLAQYVLYA